MTSYKYFEMIREIKDAAFATIGRDGRPKVRIIDVMQVEEERLYFLTARGKEFYQELEAQKFAAVTALNKNWQSIRLEGKVEKVGQDRLESIFRTNPSMNNVYPGESRNILEVFCLYEGEGEFFDLSKEPVERKAFIFGKGRMTQKSYQIGNGCIACGKCRQVCPQNCIMKGEPHKIVCKHCLHCGLCQETCPVNAISKVAN